MKKSVSKITLENGCCFDFSILKQFDKDVTTEAVSIKYVVKGIETYQVGRFSRPLTEKHFLLLDNKEPVRAFVDSRSDVKGICIEIPYPFLSMVMNASLDSAGSHVEKLMNHNIGSVVRRSDDSPLGLFLSAVCNIRDHYDTGFYFNEEYFYLELAERLVDDQFMAVRVACNLSNTKPSTQQELTRRLLLGKEYLDSCFTSPLKVQEAASAANLSLFHFYKSFKKAFGTSPYHYVMTLRIAWAKSLLLSRRSISETAFTTGFSDIQGFSKAFRRHTGINPSCYCANLQKAGN